MGEYYCVVNCVVRLTKKTEELERRIEELEKKVDDKIGYILADIRAIRCDIH